MMDGFLRCLARFSEYLVADFVPCDSLNRRREKRGFFKSRLNKPSAVDGVRTNADMSMLCAFLVKYAKPLGVGLPEGVSYDMLEEMARHSLVHAYSTHKAVRLRRCADGLYWGSVNAKKAVWESPLWAFSVAWSAFFQWDSLSSRQKESVYKLLKAECHSALQAKVRTAYSKFTRAEENGWSACLLAATLGLFPDDPLAPKWFEKMRVFAVNSYSHPSDTEKTAPIDPWYDKTSVADLYISQNLFEDYTLLKHGFFHTSYQNVVIQELGEAALALRLFQKSLNGEEKWKSRSLFHNIEPVMDNVLECLALPDGELSMPNSNDWNLFLFDQITSFSTMSTFMKDPDAAMLERLAFKNIEARQQTTPDGGWLLRADIGPQRMGVQGHRVMMAYLMNLTSGDPDLVPTRWEDFRQAHSGAFVLPCQDVVRAFPQSRFAIFSYSKGLGNFTGYVVPNSPDKAKIMVPYREGGGGNFTGWFTVEGRESNAVLKGEPFYSLKGNSFVTGGVLGLNEDSLEQSFALYATSCDAVIYIDHVIATQEVNILAERGLAAAISIDEFTGLKRVLSYNKEAGMVVDGETLVRFPGNSWANIEGEIGLLARGSDSMAFGEKTDNHSIMTAKLYGSYSDTPRMIRSGEAVCSRAAVYYTDVNPEETAELDKKMFLPDSKTLPEGWSGCIAADKDGSQAILIANFKEENSEAAIPFDIDSSLIPGVPVYSTPVRVTSGDREGIFHCEYAIRLGRGEAAGESTRLFIIGEEVEARLEDVDTIRLRSISGSRKVTVIYSSPEGKIARKEVSLEDDGKEITVKADS